MFKLILLLLTTGWGYLYFQQPNPLPNSQDVAQAIQNSIPSPQQVGTAIAEKLSANAPAPLPKIPALPTTQKTESGGTGCGQIDPDGNLKYCF